MSTGAIVFMALAWGCVLGLTAWSFWRLLKADPKHEKPPPPGTSL